ncbi:hypothetical protein HDV01_006068 [Terramyces sp. JEL0728]|nr:hypothetical protein HDV01_006068 [Terramyces sp. JEL0728]
MTIQTLPKYHSQCFTFSKDSSDRSSRNIQKPLNSFFLYIKAKRDEIAKEYKIHKSHEISKKAAELWGREPRDVKEKYREMSIETHARFKKLSSKVKSWKSPIQKNRLILPSKVAQYIGYVSADVFEATRLDADMNGGSARSLV